MKSFKKFLIESISYARSEYMIALNMYQGQYFTDINKGLRNNDYNNTYSDIIDIMDNLATLFVTDKPLYRGISTNYTKDIDIYKLTEYRDSAFLSTSFDKNVAIRYSKQGKYNETNKPWLLIIEGIKHGIDMQKMLSDNKTLEEQEFILPRNSILKINNIQQTDNNYTILCSLS